MTINGTAIFMTRGDAEELYVSCPDRPFSVGDKVELTVRTYSGYGEVLLHKEVTEFTAEGKALIVFAPEDTEKLPFETFSYDVQVTFTDLGPKTVVKPSPFEIGKENTHAN